MQIGTRLKFDPESQAITDINESRLMLRVEVTALAGLLIKKGIIDKEEFQEALTVECEQYNLILEKRFPGFRATENGMVIFDTAKATETTKGWKA
jgi:hypothetical protein